MSSTLMQQAYDRLREMIASGELAPGTRLVNRKLSQVLGLSTVTIREALQRLASEGLIEYVPNAGAYVRELSEKELYDLVRFRFCLEEFAAREGADRIDPYSLERLRGICEQWRRVAADCEADGRTVLSSDEGLKCIDLDVQFHRILAESVDNVWLTKTLDDLQLMRIIMGQKPREIPTKSVPETIALHDRIIEALEARDAPAAQEAMRLHNRIAVDYQKLRRRLGVDDSE